MTIQGRVQHTTLIGASRALYEAGMGELAVVVFLTSILGPALLISSTLYVLLGARLNLRLPMQRTLLAWIGHLVPWGMLDVFMLGVLVSFVKLAGMAEMLVGPALYAFIGLIIASSAAMSSFEPRVIWQRLGTLPS
jgi:paraquat-inducible protein A